MTRETAPKILFGTTADRGQCGVFLATVAALQRAHPQAELHFATFPCLENEVRAISDSGVRDNGSTHPISFHAIAGKTSEEAISEKLGQGAFPSPAFTRPLSTSTTMAAIRDVSVLLATWNGPEFMVVYESFRDVINSVKPDAIILDFLFAPAITAAWNSGIRFSYISPNSIKELVDITQQRMAVLWKFPVLMTGYSFPVPWRQIPTNIFIFFYMIYAALTNTAFRSARKYVQEKTGRPMRTLLDKGRTLPDYVKIFVGCLPELDYPLQSHPRVVPCGPIIAKARPVSECDPKLSAWLGNAPTIYVNLGSLYQLSEERAAEFAKGLQMVLSRLDVLRPDSAPTQVLWKLKRAGTYDVNSRDCKVHSVLGGELTSGRVRITDWLETPPISILKSGNILCSIHHGGANSYYETIIAGVPHVVLPSWTDCYDYANKVELFGIGRKGTEKQTPVFEAQELSDKVLEVVAGKLATGMRENASKLAEVCEKNGHGPDIAARNVFEFASKQEVEEPKATA